MAESDAVCVCEVDCDVDGVSDCEPVWVIEGLSDWVGDALSVDDKDPVWDWLELCV